MATDTGVEPKFDKLLNFRDVGLFLRCLSPSSPLKLNLLYRSARLDEATLSDRSKLTERFRIKTIVDLRSKTEHINAIEKHSKVTADAAEAGPASINENQAKASLKVPGLEYAEINLNGKGFERALVWQLKFLSLAKLALLMAVGYRTEGIAVLGREVMLPRGLLGLGIDTVDHSGPEIKQVFDVFSDESAYPVLVHCTQGKDRTGIIILLVLLLCGIDIDLITADYCKSEPELEPEKEEKMKEITSIGLDESFARCPPDFCERIRDYVDAKHRGIREYLQSIGIQKSQQDIIRGILLETGASSTQSGDDTL